MSVRLGGGTSQRQADAFRRGKRLCLEIHRQILGAPTNIGLGWGAGWLSVAVDG